MGFWSGETLKQRLPALINPYDSSCVDCASYILHLGEQAFVTKDNLVEGHSDTPLVQVVDDKPSKNTVIIGTGQFAFLLTEEKVTVPLDAIALISMKSKLKNKGLVNVSGFHVDPGFSGHLVFAVYNAGPKEIILQRKQDLFMIVYAGLDKSTKLGYQGKSQYQKDIDVTLLEGMTGQVFSPMMLQREMRALVREHQEIREEQLKISSSLEDTKRSAAHEKLFRQAAITTAITAIIGIAAVAVGVAALEGPKVMLGLFIKDVLMTYEAHVEKQASLPSISNLKQNTVEAVRITIDAAKVSESKDKPKANAAKSPQ